MKTVKALITHLKKEIRETKYKSTILKLRIKNSDNRTIAFINLVIDGKKVEHLERLINNNGSVEMETLSNYLLKYNGFCELLGEEVEVKQDTQVW